MSVHVVLRCDFCSAEAELCDDHAHYRLNFALTKFKNWTVDCGIVYCPTHTGRRPRCGIGYLGDLYGYAGKFERVKGARVILATYTPTRMVLNNRLGVIVSVDTRDSHRTVQLDSGETITTRWYFMEMDRS